MESKPGDENAANEFANSLSQSAIPDPLAPYNTTLMFDSENGVSLSRPKTQSFTITPALARVFVRALSLEDGNEPPLSFSTLLIAMLVDEDTWLSAHFKMQQVQVEAIFASRKINGTSLQSLNESALMSEYWTTESARAALEEAARIARLASGDLTVDTRHLCAAYPVLPNWHLQDFADFNIDRLEWARAFGAEMAQRFPNERAYWRGYADRASPVPVTAFSADVYAEEDLLGIERSVDALALLIASTRTATPLAIGVFGPWGSGKSFFMRHLQKRIVGIRRSEWARIDAWNARRNEGTAQPDDSPPYFGKIAQVEFNAWHYNEANLVASLVEHLFRNLRVSPDESDDQLAGRRVEMLKKLKVLRSDLATIEDVIAEAERKIHDAKDEVKRATREAEDAKNDVGVKALALEEQIKKGKDEFAAESKRLDNVLESISSRENRVDPEAVIAVALEPLVPLVEDVRKTIALVRDQTLDWNFFARVFTGKGAIVILLCVVAPIVLWVKQQLPQAQWAAVTGSLLAASTVLVKAFDVFKQYRTRFVEKLGELETEQKKRVEEARERIKIQRGQLAERAQHNLDKLSKALEEERSAFAKREKTVNDAARELARRAREHDARLGDRVKAEQRVREAEAELERLSSAVLLEEFINDRSSTDEYRKQLGFLALVRRDIERLSKLIDDANGRWLDTGNTDPSPLLNRIVLYIDDLDRCKESTVLAVLEAVHLLLAFPLFVCAVAVDPRWVEKCLRESHKQFFIDDESKSNSSDNAPATVGDYLEKIFQIPIWMSPIESRTRATLVNSLLGPTAAPAPRRTRMAQSVAAAPTASRDPVEASTFSGALDGVRARPDPLRIAPEEAAFVEEIAGLLSDRPRALKRFVNIYRLLKASLPDIERESFVSAAPSSGYRICLSQLALFTGHPRLAPPLVAALERGYRGAHENDGTTSTGETEQWMSLEDWYDTLGPAMQSELRNAFKLIPNPETLQLGEFRRWLPLTSRYLFHRAD